MRSARTQNRLSNACFKLTEYSATPAFACTIIALGFALSEHLFLSLSVALLQISRYYT